MKFCTFLSKREKHVSYRQQYSGYIKTTRSLQRNYCDQKLLIQVIIRMLRDHLCSISSKFSDKLTFLTP